MYCLAVPVQVKQHEMVDSARDSKREERKAQLEKLRRAIAQQGGQADATQQEELKYLEEWEAADRLFTPGWKAEGAKLKKQLEAVRKGEGSTLYTEGRESKRALMEASQAATAMAVFNKLSPKHQDKFPLNTTGPAALPRIPIVLLVRNNTEALLLCLQALSRVQGIDETLLIVRYAWHPQRGVTVGLPGYLGSLQVCIPAQHAMIITYHTSCVFYIICNQYYLHMILQYANIIEDICNICNIICKLLFAYAILFAYDMQLFAYDMR